MSIRNKFDAELKELHSAIIKMGAAVEEAIGLSVKALMTRDAELAKSVIENDKKINEMNGAIGSSALKIMLCQQPVASDLRAVSTALRMVGEIERMGDQAADICSIVLRMCEEGCQTDPAFIPRMAEIARRMVRGCIDSFVRTDLELAKVIIETDNEMDELFIKSRQELIDLIKTNAAVADQAIYLMMIAKYFEKIGDYAENVASWVIFSVTGNYKGNFLI